MHIIILCAKNALCERHVPTLQVSAQQPEC
jgi:hypothetical protein